MPKFKLLLALILLLVQPLPGITASRLPVRGRQGMVASVSEIASRVGVEIMKQGGNAVDAAVAVGLALAVVWPEAGNLGGGGFMMIRLANGTAVAVDYRESGPAIAKRESYLDEHGVYIPGSSTLGHRAAGVPGTIAGFSFALSKYGRLSWAQVCEPARQLARDGFPVWYSLERSLRNSASELEKFPESRRIFLRNGRPYVEGEIFIQPELAATFDRLIKSGPREFYEGETARMIVSTMEAEGGKWITLDDLRNYQVHERTPLKASYRGHEIITMPPPSSGGIALIEMLNMLSRFDLKAMGFGSSAATHVKIEAMRRAFADRSEFLGDTDFVKVPVAGLTSPRYARKIGASINISAAGKSTLIGHGNPSAYESAETTHYTVVDKEGNAVSNTYTLNGSFGSKLTVKDAGFLLNNEMDDFTANPGKPNMYGLIQSEKNSVAAGKRPLSAMTPTFVLKDGKLWFALGSPGGPTIINTVLQTILNVIDFDMNIQEAVDAPRVHHQWLPDEIFFEPRALVPDVSRRLKAMGHHFRSAPGFAGGPFIGDCEAIMIEPGTGIRLGASDPRRGGQAVGY